jgi:hypothetical protein
MNGNLVKAFQMPFQAQSADVGYIYCWLAFGGTKMLYGAVEGEG